MKLNEYRRIFILKCKDNISLLNNELNNSSLKNYNEIIDSAADGLEDFYNKTSRKDDFWDDTIGIFSGENDSSISQKIEDIKTFKELTDSSKWKNVSGIESEIDYSMIASSFFNPIKEDAKKYGIDIG